MSHVLMINGRPETIQSVRDFEDAIDRHMGSECADYYHEQMEALSSCIEELAEDNDYIENYLIEEVLKEYGYE